MKNMKKLISVLLVVAMAFSMAACAGGDAESAGLGNTASTESVTTESATTEQEQASEPVVIAICGPTTGNNSYSGGAMVNGAKMRIEQYNAAGGYNGTPIEIEIFDTKADANEGVTIAQKIVGDGKATAIIGPWSSTVALAMAPVIDKAELLMYSPTPTHDDLTKSSEWVIRQCALSANIASGSAEGFLRNGYKNCGYLFDNSNEGAVKSSSIFKEIFEAGGGVCTLSGYSQGTKDFTPVLTSFKQMGVDCINTYGGMAEIGLIVTQARDLDIDCIINLPAMAVNEELCSIIAGYENIYLCDSFAYDYPSDSLKTLEEDYYNLFGSKLILHSYLGYTAADRLLAAMDEFGAEDKEGMRAYLRNSVAETPLGTLTFKDGDADYSMIWSKFNGTDAFLTDMSF